MAYVRGQERLVYESVNDYLKSQLTALGWINSGINPQAMPTPVLGPFASTVSVTLLDAIPLKTAVLADNSVAFTSGQEKDVEGEVGASLGGLWITNHVFHIDIFGESQGIAKAIQADIRALLTGRLAGSSRYIPLMDKTVSPNVVLNDHLLHFEDVETDTPLDQAWKQDWRVVHLTAVHEYNAQEIDR